MRETGDPDSEWPDRIKEKVGSCYYVTIITHCSHTADIIAAGLKPGVGALVLVEGGGGE